MLGTTWRNFIPSGSVMRVAAQVAPGSKDTQQNGLLTVE